MGHRTVRISINAYGIAYVALLFVFLAYELHPTMKKTLARLKVYRARRRRIRNGEPDEAAEEFKINEIERRRGTWDAARLTALFLIVLSLGSFLDLVKTPKVDEVLVANLMNRPPPYFYRDDTTGPWKVRSHADFSSADGNCFLGNFKETLETRSASTRFRAGSDSYKGSTLSAWWSDNAADAHSSLSYDVYGNGTAVLSNLTCTTWNGRDLYVGEDSEKRWGTALECGNGPIAVTNTDGLSPPTILLQNDATGVIHLIVEEESNYPGFMYSVWTPVDETTTAASTNVTIRHSFHVASKTPLAEVIVTGIVNGVETGEGCVDFFFQHSQWNKVNELDGKSRACPFGDPLGDTSAVSDLPKLEPGETGVITNGSASTCFVFVMIAWVLCIAFFAWVSRFVDTDVYDRDERFRGGDPGTARS